MYQTLLLWDDMILEWYYTEGIIIPWSMSYGARLWWILFYIKLIVFIAPLICCNFVIHDSLFDYENKSYDVKWGIVIISKKGNVCSITMKTVFLKYTSLCF